MKTRLFLLACLGVSLLSAADSVPQFNATLSIGKEHRFVLIDGQGKASSFLSLGETFAGYRLKTYEAKTGVLQLERDGKVFPVTLVAEAAVKDAPPPPVPATIADAEAVLNKMHFDEMIERTLAQQKKMIAGQFQQMVSRMTAQGVDPEAAAAFQKKLTDEIFGIFDPKQLKSEVSRIYSEVFSKQELDQLSSFFSTPLGEMLSTRQPAIQEKLGVVMQSKMAEVMPRVQKLGAEFAAEQKAKGIAVGGGSAPAPTPKK
ncbi:MAG: DUF2059 domain-containing protein [Verrucomicrobia bacterium]|nr:DUF2059 domain-containing protein [Verrucomicrobiota bacterium]